MAVDLRCDIARACPYARALERSAYQVMRSQKLDRCELSISLVSDAAIRRLNRDYRHKDKATDVLSFSQVEEREATPPDPNKVANRPETVLGDIVISIDTAARQAQEYGIGLDERLCTLLIHGFLHLIGYDHERSARDERLMQARERELATILGMAPALKTHSSRPPSKRVRAGKAAR